MPSEQNTEASVHSFGISELTDFETPCLRRHSLGRPERVDGVMHIIQLRGHRVRDMRPCASARKHATRRLRGVWIGEDFTSLVFFSLQRRAYPPHENELSSTIPGMIHHWESEEPTTIEDHHKRHQRRAWIISCCKHLTSTDQSKGPEKSTLFTRHTYFDQGESYRMSIITFANPMHRHDRNIGECQHQTLPAIPLQSRHTE